ncbi:hypothetical protein L7F22_057399 [Adiantum nelumboides]|nr:hypothetical protein [Adiantum nelumboides]
MAAHSECNMRLSKELLAWEPVRLVTPNYQPLSPGATSTIATKQLSNLDMLFDYYNFVICFYHAHPHSASFADLIPPLARLHRALQELRVHWTCSGGLLMDNATNGRLEVHYPKGWRFVDHHKPLIHLALQEVSSFKLYDQLPAAVQHRSVMAAQSECSMRLSKELLAWEPVRLVTPNYQPLPPGATSTVHVATKQLSNLDMLFDYYNSVVLFYHARPHSASSADLLQDQSAHPSPHVRLHRALQELLVHWPCAGGLLMENATNGRLEVHYPKYVLGIHDGAGQRPPVNDMSTNAASQHVAASPAPSLFGLDAQSTTADLSFGVPFHVAHASVALADLGDVSIPHQSLDLLFPSKPVQDSGSDEPRHLICRGQIQALQVTDFSCGGFSVASTCSHAYADGYTAAIFLKNLCSIARGAGLATPPDMSLTRTVVLGAREPPTPTVHHPFIQARRPTEKPPLTHLHYGTATRFAFNADGLERLRLRVSKDGESRTYTRTQALMALLRRAFARMSLEVRGLPGSHVIKLRFPINLRTRGIPNLTAGYMGNAVYQCTELATLQELCESSLGGVADKLKDTMASLDLAECVRSMLDYVELQLRDGLIPYMTGLGMPSLVGLPFYDTDCGWGNPMYVGHPSQQLSDRCIILDHPASRAWNVLMVFSSSEEHACFKDSIAEYIVPDVQVDAI